MTWTCAGTPSLLWPSANIQQDVVCSPTMGPVMSHTGTPALDKTEINIGGRQHVFGDWALAVSLGRKACCMLWEAGGTEEGGVDRCPH